MIARSLWWPLGAAILLITVTILIVCLWSGEPAGPRASKPGQSAVTSQQPRPGETDSGHDVREPALFGRVIDQNGEPVVGAVVKVRYGGVNLPHDPVFRTDQNGRFTLLNAPFTAYRLVSAERDGYVIEPKPLRLIQLHRGYPDRVGRAPDNPWTIRMWRSSEASGPLVECRAAEPPACLVGRSGQAAQLQIVSGPNAEPLGAIAISVSLDGDVYDPKSGWVFTIDSEDFVWIDAGEDPFRYEAPNAGYEPRLQWRFTAAQQEVRKHVYFKTSTGKFGNLSFVLQLIDPDWRDQASLQVLRMTMNPTGSRNLVPTVTGQAE